MKVPHLVLMACVGVALVITVSIISYAAPETPTTPDILQYKSDIDYILENYESSAIVDATMEDAMMAYAAADGNKEKAIKIVEMWLEEYDRIFEKFRSHDIYKTFKEKYPDSTDSYGTSHSILLHSQYDDEYENTIMLFVGWQDNEVNYMISCPTDQKSPGGGTGNYAFYYLENNDCIQE